MKALAQRREVCYNGKKRDKGGVAVKKHKGRALLAAVALLLAALWALWPRSAPAADPSSRQVLSGERSQLDLALLEKGVVEVRCAGRSGVKLKVQITQPDGSDYNYDLNGAGEWERFPLTQGDGTYTVKLLEHIEGDRYAIRDTYPLELTLSDPLSPFLLPSQMVNYAEDSEAVRLAGRLTALAKDDRERIALLFDYVVDHIDYDYDKSASVEPGYLPDPDGTLAAGKGICLDYAALLCAMARSQGIPCRLVTGYAGKEKTYHAWVEVWCETGGTVDGAIPITAGAWSRLDPTFVSGGDRSREILDFVTDDGNYETLSVY